jgi:membrane carboxypeptidase/penicillin-binding protein PbpC
VMSRGACAVVDDILSSRRRRPAGMESRLDQDVPWFMWKTGTSSGRRDAWAVGHNGRYAIGVWVGRFSGGGSAEFVGARAAEPVLAELFDVRALRRMEGPEAPPPLIVRCPLPPPAELGGPLRILSPSQGSSFVAVGEGAIIHPRANRPGLSWFLNGRLIDSAGPLDRIVLSVGSYGLRCVGQDGQAAGVAFTVRPPPRGSGVALVR